VGALATGSGLLLPPPPQATSTAMALARAQHLRRRMPVRPSADIQGFNNFMATGVLRTQQTVLRKHSVSPGTSRAGRHFEAEPDDIRRPGARNDQVARHAARFDDGR
jgi:hypothetical protein